MQAPGEAKEGREGANDANLHGNEPNQKGQHDVPLVQQQADVHAGAGCHEEEPEQHSSEWPDVRLNLHTSTRIL